MSDASPRQTRVDVLVAGGGAAGLALALALKTAVGGRLAVSICDPALAAAPRRDDRAFAVAAGARRMLEVLGAWDEIETDAEPIRSMKITDSRTFDPVRPVFLDFGGGVGPDEPFAHMVEHASLIRALSRRATEAGVEVRAERVLRVEPQPHMARVRVSGGETLSVGLVAACDGAASPLREQAGIGTVSWPYRQSGIVATIGHERDHEGRAEEHFLPSGPFAILPLRGRRSSIVWTERSENVPALLGLADDDLLAEIERRFGLRHGRLTLETRPAAWPLQFMVARRFAGERLALVADAAHVIHPIAGQGLNLGFRDVAALAEAIVDAAQLGLDPGSPDVLAAYERARRFDTVAMGMVMEGLNRLFSNDNTPLRLLRDAGLGMVDRMPGLKRFFIRQAAAVSPDMPRLLRGVPL
ncbi:2-octaprenyl-6-methoxyphenyl hydroxylase [Alsobacter metallidurans]|uniref:2-octaprenyl-6-methoxyphenyl hydroxylase n=1 Tax=Alsobacter metallidurans TaxID=340221 RepID=A0A917ID04_9HYPH|nr:ubiquinone biosynthesis hydroxylase [Alsobacter metallidurans]GGH33533.1 2-octaprenyl-6-methoxyphenyl hydroxylase [Alsobacter metallidurans]